MFALDFSKCLPRVCNLAVDGPLNSATLPDLANSDASLASRYTTTIGNVQNSKPAFALASDVLKNAV